MAGPCPWTINTACCPGWETYTPDQQELGTVWATEILWALSGRRYGLCQMTVRPCEPCHARTYVTYPVFLDGSASGGSTWFPYIDGGQWYNCYCPGACCCDPGCRVALSMNGPISAIISVSVNGILVPDTAYRVVDGMWLVRQDGQCWPKCQSLGNPDDSSDNTFVVELVVGEPVPPSGSIAAGILACQIAGRCAGGDCSVPFNITTLTREGVTVQVGDTTTVGKTGIDLVDQWVNTVNPYGLASRPAVWNPDLPGPEVTTWSA